MSLVSEERITATAPKCGEFGESVSRCPANSERKRTRQKHENARYFLHQIISAAFSP